jgi:proteasome accessory factor C
VTARISSSDRLRRILAIVPWIAERDGPTIAEISDRFAIDRADLLADLDVVFMVGIPPYTPDTLIDVVVDDDRVWITLGDYFRRPLRLTPAEGLSLLAAGEAMRGAPGDDAGSSLSRGLEKLAGALGVRVGNDGELDVSLGDAPPAIVELLRAGAQSGRQVELDYYSYGRDSRTVRVVDPYRVYAQEGNWYLLGWCHRANDERVFRIDRIESARQLSSTFKRPAALPDATVFETHDDDLLVTLRLQPEARWVVEHYPVVDTRVGPKGTILVTLAVSAVPWLARLLVTLGPAAEVVDVAGGNGEPSKDIEALAADTATRILARYNS